MKEFIKLVLQCIWESLTKKKTEVYVSHIKDEYELKFRFYEYMPYRDELFIDFDKSEFYIRPREK